MPQNDEISPSVQHITLSRGAKILADTQFETLKEEHKDDFDAVSNKLVGCICAGSLAAKTAGIGLGLRITSHPSVKGDLEKHYEYIDDERVVVDGNLVTSFVAPRSSPSFRGPGTAIDWALTIVQILAGKAKRDEVAGPMML
ncbi:SPOSA6832_04002 [Sporobolomyces salmonicolor]|uniref:D-lactate dehydratase n=1 Tax=Sporidiobolus salmonicolor TaxID=5005 RepID=A0A0D6EQR9_SPOSA|nr:SPOSA6832_04002 [Sporobolomyces salmonicolor]